MTAVADPCHNDTPGKNTTIHHNNPGRLNGKEKGGKVFVIMNACAAWPANGVGRALLLCEGSGRAGTSEAEASSDGGRSGKC
jgi:hypothetical protein